MGRFLLYQAFGALVYVVVGRALLRRVPPRFGRALFALWNLGGFMAFWIWAPGLSPRAVVARTTIYVVLVAIHFGLMLWMARSQNKKSWPAAIYPIALLVVFKYTKIIWGPIAAAHGLAPEGVQRDLLATFVGLSYMAFRLSQFTIQVRNSVVRMPTIWEHFSFSFFVPTAPVGPISPGSVFIASLDRPAGQAPPLSRSLLRVLVGATKYLFLAGALAHLTYADLLNDGHPHPGPIDWIVSAIGYYLYLYCNFSGFCDLAIGGAGLMGISVIENFNAPFLARNVKDFWNRWHMSLTRYVREMLFSPLSKTLAAAMGSSNVNHAIALALLVTFIATGVWHGVGLNFFYFGLLHGIAMVIHNYYTLFLRKRLSRDQLQRYNESTAVRAGAIAITFSFVTATMFVFANDVPTIERILTVVPSLEERGATKMVRAGQDQGQR